MASYSVKKLTTKYCENQQFTGWGYRFWTILCEEQCDDCRNSVLKRQQKTRELLKQ
jgi:hypothetical protein